MLETINIVLSSDNNYAQYTGVAICSIFENKKDGYDIDIYVLDGGIQEDNKDKLKYLEEKYSFKINYIKIDTFLYNDFYTNEHLPQAAYYRILIPNLLPNLNKALYLDCDTIIINDAYKLYKTNISNYYFAAVGEEKFYPERYHKLKMPTCEKYFNSGVMLINLEKWRKNKISELVIKFIKENPTIIKFCDQDAMNATMWGKWLNISYRYNYMSWFFQIHPVNINKLKEKITIIHYTESKPWNYLCTHPLKKEYFYYLSKTPWRNQKYINKNIKTVSRKILKTILPRKLINFIKKYYA